MGFHGIVHAVRAGERKRAERNHEAMQQVVTVATQTAVHVYEKHLSPKWCVASAQLFFARGGCLFFLFPCCRVDSASSPLPGAGAY